MFYLTLLAFIYPVEWLSQLSGVTYLSGSRLFSDSPLSGAVFDLYFSLRHAFNSFFFSNYLVMSTCVAALKLIALWFFVVWLRMNLLRYRFDQVASYTWHELVILGVCILVQAIILV